MTETGNDRLVLGTAQLGMPYGIANKSGQPSFIAAREIVQTAWECGIRSFDTASGYGESEAILGRVLSDLGIVGECRIITKLDPGLDLLDEAAVDAAVHESLTRLGVPCLHCLMLHRESSLDLLDRSLADVLSGYVKEGLAGSIGISVYSPEKALQALEKGIVRSIQVPANILDHRFRNAGAFRRAHDAGKEIYIRSVYLQGLLMLGPEGLPPALAYAESVLRKFNELACEYSLTRQQAALGYVKRRYPFGYVLFGVETPAQVRENAAAWMVELPESFLAKAEELFDSVDERIINPVLWKAS